MILRLQKLLRSERKLRGKKRLRVPYTRPDKAVITEIQGRVLAFEGYLTWWKFFFLSILHPALKSLLEHFHTI